MGGGDLCIDLRRCLVGGDVVADLLYVRGGHIRGLAQASHNLVGHPGGDLIIDRSASVRIGMEKFFDPDRVDAGRKKPVQKFTITEGIGERLAERDQLGTLRANSLENPCLVLAINALHAGPIAPSKCFVDGR